MLIPLTFFRAAKGGTVVLKDGMTQSSEWVERELFTMSRLPRANSSTQEYSMVEQLCTLIRAHDVSSCVRESVTSAHIFE